MRILIIRAGALGDTLMLMPSIAFLNRRADILVAGRLPGIDFLRPYVKDCVDLEMGGWHGIFTKDPKEMRGISLPKPDPQHVIAFMNDPDGVVRSNLEALFPESRIGIFSPFQSESVKTHIALYMAECIESAGLPMNARAAFDAAYKRALIAGTDSSSKGEGIVFHPGSGSATKNYSKELWLELIKDISQTAGKKTGDSIVLLGPAEEALVPFFEGALKKTTARVVFYPEKKDLLFMLEKAALYIGHDSGITHLAAMTGAPVIALFKMPSYQWTPVGPRVRVIFYEKENLEILAEKIWLFPNFSKGITH